MDRIYPTMDDIGMYLNLEAIDKLKEKMPDFKITLFVIPKWDYGQPISSNKKFVKWFEARRDWVEIAIHGFTHTGHKYNMEVEGKRSYSEQFSLYKHAVELLKPFLPEKFGFKAPGNHSNEATLMALTRLGFSYFAFGNDVLPLNGGFEPGRIVTSHIQEPESYQDWNFKGEMKMLYEGIK